MGKLQTNFSWQAYQGKPEEVQKQFEYRLQAQHLLVSNTTNATIDDASFFTHERQTSFTWVNGQPIYTKTLPTSAWAGTTNTIPLGITGDFTVIDMVCCISDGALSTSTTLLLPYIDVTDATKNISIIRIATDVILTSALFNYSAYSGYVTVYYIKAR